jgi:hypothetical protein
MPSPPSPPSPTPSDPQQPRDESSKRTWDAEELMRARAAQTRRERDQAIAELRESINDDQVLDEFGIDLGEIER